MADALIEKISPSKSPAELFSSFRSRPYPFFLDSALKDRRLGRFSFLGCEPFLVFKSKRDSVTLEWAGGETERFRADPFFALKDIFERYGREDPGKPAPFPAGGVGYLSYDMKDFIEDLPDAASGDLGLPDCVMGFYDTVVIHDNFSDSVYISSCGLPFSGAKGRRKASERLAKFKAMTKEKFSAVAARAPSRGAAGRIASNFSRPAYIDAVKRAKAYIKKGDIYQVNLSQRFRAGLDTDPADLYYELRKASPAPFAAYLGFGDFAVLSSSPERFLLKRGRYVETRPIKGTRPRGRDAAGDAAMERELAGSVKDNAEHIMIVDLERNDLGKVCDYGSVMLAGDAAVERYANVFHLVSTVSGTLKKGVGPIDCLRAAFPGGSITGAPKVRSMEIIEELEPVKRSVYTGAIGYISFGGGMDMSIAIRTLIVKGGAAYFSVGGGIVADSDPEAEYQETLDKAAGILRALGGKAI